MTDASYCPSFNPDLEAWLHPLRTLAATLYDLGHPCLADECWDLAAEIEATANPIFEEE